MCLESVHVPQGPTRTNDTRYVSGYGRGQIIFSVKREMDVFIATCVSHLLVTYFRKKRFWLIKLKQQYWCHQVLNCFTQHNFSPQQATVVRSGTLTKHNLHSTVQWTIVANASDKLKNIVVYVAPKQPDISLRSWWRPKQHEK